MSERTAYLYARTLDLVEGVLEGMGADVVSASPAQLAAMIATFPATHSRRQMVRSAVLAAWDVSGRDGPRRALRVPPKPRPRCRALSVEAAQRLAAAAWAARASNPGLATLLGLYGALRRCEIASLRWSDVIPGESGRPEWLRVTGKGDLQADVPCHPVLSDALAPAVRGDGWLFPSPRGGRGHVRPVTVWQWVRDLAGEAGVGDVPTHVLRHTALASINDVSGDLRATQEIARHAKPETTAGYTRVGSARLVSVIRQLDYQGVAA